MNEKWYRVNKKRPCAVCSRIDWCTYQESGSCCMRIQSETSMRNGGWLHKTDTRIPYIPPAPIRKAVEDKPLDATGMWFKWFSQTDFQQMDQLGISLGVDTDALKAIGCAWAGPHNAWAFPMRDALGKVIGIRLRNSEGHKWAVKGSRQGIFIPNGYPLGSTGTLWLTEGPTDLAAALTLGLPAIARAACLGQESMLISYLQSQKVRRLVIVTDNDEPGLRGAEKLQAMLPIPSCIYVPCCKDIREFLLLGGDSRMIEASVKDIVWQRPKVAA